MIRPGRCNYARSPLPCLVKPSPSLSNLVGRLEFDERVQSRLAKGTIRHSRVVQRHFLSPRQVKKCAPLSYRPSTCAYLDRRREK